MVCPAPTYEHFASVETKPKSADRRNAIGNRISSSSDESGSTVTRNYTANSLNQYTAITNPSESPTFGDDGNLMSDTDFDTYTWNAENRLSSVSSSPSSSSSPAPIGIKL